MNVLSPDDMPALSSVRRSALRARAHALNPVVMISEAGLSPRVVAEIERSLKSHELIKIRTSGAERLARAALLAEICMKTGAQPVQHIGKVLVVYRENSAQLQPAPLGAPKPRRNQQPQVPGARDGRRLQARQSTGRTSPPRRQPYQPASRRTRPAGRAVTRNARRGSRTA
jgi:RNA-binding protein